MFNNNLNVNNQSQNSQKKDLLFICGFSCMLLCFCAFFNNNQIFALIIALISIAAIIIFYLLITARKVLSKNDIYLNIGIVGLVTSTICNLLIVVHRCDLVLRIIVAFAILMVVSLLVSTFFALLIKKIKKNTKKDINLTPFSFVGALFGVTLYKYFRKNGIDIPIFTMIWGMIWGLNLILTILAISNLFKIKKASNS